MKVFWVFCWDQYYPQGGLANLHDTFEDEADAQRCAAELEKNNDHVEVVDVSDRLGLEPRQDRWG